MAEVARGEQSLLTSKWGPLPVWLWGAIGLVVAWIIAKWRSSQADKAAAQKADTADLADTAESEQVAPQFIIENNMPAGAGAPTTPQAPITTLPAPVPVVTPPGKSPNPPVKTPPKPPAPGKPTKKPPKTYTVKHGDTLSAIAKRYGTTWQSLWTYNTTPGNRPADTIKTLKERGPSLLYAGEKILIPQK